MRPRKNWGFTLVELLVVIIIIGILAAVAIPQFGDSSLEAKKSALKEDLRLMRSLVEKYYQEHTSLNPGVVKTHKDKAGDPAAAHANVADAFLKQMTCYSDSSGNTCSEKSSSFPYGPYIRTKIPDNPLPADTAVGTASTVNVTTDTTRLTADAAPTTGWKFSNATGELIANNTVYASY